MNNLINKVIGWFRANPIVMTALVAFFVILIALLLFWYGITLKNRVSSWWYSRGTNQAHEEIDKARGEAAAAKQVAEDALKELAAEKEVTKAEREKRETLEKLLADKSKTVDAKLQAYDEALKHIPAVRTESESIDQQCKRAAGLGVQLSICQ